MRIGSLFSGIGGLELGLEMGLGHAETVWQVEYEEHARLVLEQHWPQAERHKDVRHVGGANLTPVDLICGGFPCQPHSVAGKRQSSNDERDLWAEFARIVGEVKPRWVVAENVPGLLSSTDPAFSRNHAGGFFGRVLRDLAQMGFDAEWGCFPAAAVGALHTRNRVFIVAYAPQLLGNGGNDYAGGDQQGEWAISKSGNRHRLPTWAGGDWQQPKPVIRGMADGIPLRVDRLARLGNGVVPQQAAVIGRAVKEAESYWREFGVMPERIIQPRHFRRAS